MSRMCMSSSENCDGIVKTLPFLKANVVTALHQSLQRPLRPYRPCQELECLPRSLDDGCAGGCYNLSLILMLVH
jgi:hypothetical protein